LCRQACIDDNKCLAWTFVKATSADKAACNLKTPAPYTKDCKGCISGLVRSNGFYVDQNLEWGDL